MNMLDDSICKILDSLDGRDKAILKCLEYYDTDISFFSVSDYLDGDKDYSVKESGPGFRDRSVIAKLSRLHKLGLVSKTNVFNNLPSQWNLSPLAKEIVSFL